jgi:murein DD-endopeptidase MepM/ murein hydrolase activator NlpD
MHNVATSRILHAPEPSTPAEPRKPWIWPLPRLDGVAPSITSLPGQIRGDRVVDLDYHGRTSSPSFVPVFAAQDGIITYAARTDRGATICLDHPGSWSTQYEELEHVLVMTTDRFRCRRKARVRAGDVLGHARRASLRIRFALSQLTDGKWVVVEPAELMHTWSVLPWFADPSPDTAAQLAA